MKKRILSLLLAILMLVSLLPMNAGAVTKSEREQIKAAVENVVMDFSKRVGRSSAAGDAFEDFFMQGFFGNGKKMTLTETDNLIATAFASNWLPFVLVEGITESIIQMERLGVDQVFVGGGPNWKTNVTSFGYAAYTDTKKNYNEYHGPTITSQQIFGTNQYKCQTNDCDDMMTILVGELQAEFMLYRTEIKEDCAVYKIDLTMCDIFDFDAKGYESLNKQGINTVKDDRLKYFGYLMTFMGLDEFSWEFKKTFTVEVPFDCDHNQSGSYGWSLDESSMQLTSYGGNSYTLNTAEQNVYVPENGNARYYYELDNPVILRHDAPWVVELEMTGSGQVMFSTVVSTFNQLPRLCYMNHSQAWFIQRDIESDGTEYSTSELYYEDHYVGVDVAEKFSYRANHRYLVQFENCIQSNGENMITVEVFDITSGETVVPSTEMVTDWIMYKEENTRVQQEKPTDRISGQDMLINYIGNPSSLFRGKDLEIRIYENGDEQLPVEKSPTCTEQGGTVHTCRDCGYSYMTDVVPATGHSFGEYVFDNNASCTADGTRTRKCTVCGVSETVAAPDTLKGHNYKAAVTEPTYEQQGYTTYTCTVCGDSYKDDYTDVKKHSYVGVVTEPTCIAQGYTTYTCFECGDTYMDDYTELADHTPVIDPYVAPTCVEKGKMEGSHCGVCGLVLKKQALISTTDTHRMEESVVKMPTYDEPGQVAYTCQDCGKTDYMEVPPLDKPTPENPFTDVSESDWFYEPVLWAVQEGVTGGKTETTFAPNEGCTRAQVVTFLWAANGKPAPVNTNNPFSDIGESDWYYNAVLWAVENGITTGVSATEFGPEQTCTRAQIATFLWAANGKMPANGKSEFVDVADSDWYAAPIIWAKENDITGGIGEGKFGPNDTCTRAQVVTFLNKVYNK